MAKYYLDYSATTPVDKRVVERMVACMSSDGVFGNPASRSHSFGWEAEQIVDQARRQVAALIGADHREIVFTSGATEANNLAIKGVAEFYAPKGRHIVTTSIEHKAVLDTCRALEGQGCEITYLDPAPSGEISPARIADSLRDDTILVSCMHVNNEIGTVNDIAKIGEITREHGVLLHVDAAQSCGKIPVDVGDNIDLLSMSAHKFYGPKGVGALYVRRRPRVRISAQMHGGGHERGMRSGTLATHQLAGIGTAAEIAGKEMNADQANAVKCRERLLAGLADIEEIYINGENTIPHILNISFNYIEGEALIMSIPDFAVSSGSACTSASLEPSYVLRALGRSDELAHSSLRFSFGRFTTLDEIDAAVAQLRNSVIRLRELSPLWEMHQDGIDLSKVEWVEH